MVFKTKYEIGDVVFTVYDFKVVSFTILGIGICSYKEKEPTVTLYGKDFHEYENRCFKTVEALMDYIKTPA